MNGGGGVWSERHCALELVEGLRFLILLHNGFSKRRAI